MKDPKKPNYFVEEEDFFLSVANTLRDAVIVLDSELRILFANQRFYTLFQISPQECECFKIYDLGNGQWNIPKLRVLLEDILPSKSQFEDFEVAHEFPTIGPKILRLNGRQIVGPPPVKQPVILLVVEDITECTRVTRERDEALKSREELVAVVSHEIKNPLTTITSGLDLLKKTIPAFPERPTVDSLLDQMRTATRRMERITADLLDITRIELGRLPLEPATVDIPNLVDEAIARFQPQADQKSIQIEKQLDSEVKLAFFDHERISQVLMNLLDNAIKFTGTSGKVRINVTQTANQIRFEVEDTGPGIATNELPHVFERFWQAKHRQYIGTGLGLYIAKCIVAAHGGAIGVESKIGQGSKFNFLLPVSPVRNVDIKKCS